LKRQWEWLLSNSNDSRAIDELKSSIHTMLRRVEHERRNEEESEGERKRFFSVELMVVLSRDG
jgi:hypothetical protein